MADHITRYDRMPIPPIEANTEYVEAGVLRIGIEYRELTDELVAAIRQTLQAATGNEEGPIENLDDDGVSLHVFAEQDGEMREHLRFDCFREDPHYHYVNWTAHSNEVLRIDPVADGDPVDWALARLRSRLPQMLVRAGAVTVVPRIDTALLDAAMPLVTEAAYRLRFPRNHTTSTP